MTLVHVVGCIVFVPPMLPPLESQLQGLTMLRVQQVPIRQTSTHTSKERFRHGHAEKRSFDLRVYCGELLVSTLPFKMLRPPQCSLAPKPMSAAARFAAVQIFLVTETANSNGVYRSKAEPLLATTHPIPPSLLHARAHAADASASALTVTASLESPAELHYAVFPATSVAIRPGDRKAGDPTVLEGVPSHGQHRNPEDGARADVIVREYKSDGCGNASISGRGPLALNDTTRLVTSGVVPASGNSSLSSNGNGMTTTPGAAIVGGRGKPFIVESGR